MPRESWGGLAERLQAAVRLIKAAQVILNKVITMERAEAREALGLTPF
jgi:hypothetical protein